MSKQPAIGMIGIGLMGHGIAWNIAKAGYGLTILDHPGNQPTDDLREMGVQVAARIADVAQAADVIVLCVTGSPQVEAILTGDDGVIAHLRPGTIVVDCSTALPESSRRMAEAVAAAGGQFLDAAMTRLPQHARAGTLNLLIGGEPALLEQLRPLLQTFSENITHIGGVGSGHLMKLMHNYVSLGFVALLAEVAAHGQKAGLEMATLIDVLAQGGGGGTALQRISPFLLEGNPASMPFTISNAAKDLGYYRQAAEASGMPRAIADAVGSTLDGAVSSGHGQDYVPQLAALLKP
ncbi:NAD(P)-dependent oxidoreductase [Pseudoroseomonas wenyumeiae]|uniref:NAD(P)-dependent oxidoreductase n=1 Tax=Teichococcus wenyumeiae TaxID=2478470 RepID=A0A3A9JEE9_9PROT|nr:NAD(P)-dependent oxidoreductase [Pseudoroseomonas wenyumeiae]RKK03043.1 NAD(P)-dependent oxidoreductase [Pseudoroseomonas wenyumeiae]RMI26860.1 NAD(P)-dependent oxidoreductase [Pseudoroseomonas wenyumeiae]